MKNDCSLLVSSADNYRYDAGKSTRGIIQLHTYEYYHVYTCLGPALIVRNILLGRLSTSTSLSMAVTGCCDAIFDRGACCGVPQSSEEGACGKRNKEREAWTKWPAAEVTVKPGQSISYMTTLSL
jgi:hypothetical protein